MKISEILNSSVDLVKSKIGIGPYLYYSDGKIIISPSLEHIISCYTQGEQIIEDIEIYAYGFKNGNNDNLQYINPDDLKRRFEEMEKEDSYEIITPEESNGKIYYVPESCNFDTISYYYYDCDRKILL